MPSFVLVGFDEWCRIKSGLSNSTIASAVSTDGASYSESEVREWREGAAIPDPVVTLQPLQMALKGPWPPATAEQVWKELIEMIGSATNGTAAPKRAAAPKAPAPKASPKLADAKVEPVGPKTDPVLDANKVELELATDQLAPAMTAAEQISLGGLGRTSEKYKKYVLKRDTKHRKAFLEFSVARAEISMEKARARRAELWDKISALKAAIDTFEAMKQECSDKLGRKIDENIGLWRELKLATPVISKAQQAYDRATSKNLATLDEAIKRAEGLLADWKSKHAAIADEGSVTLSWVKDSAALRERLEHAWETHREKAGEGFAWPAGFDPFEGHVICKDKLADTYKAGQQLNNRNPVEIDVAAEIDLTLAGLEERQRVARETIKA